MKSAPIPDIRPRLQFNYMSGLIGREGDPPAAGTPCKAFRYQSPDLTSISVQAREECVFCCAELPLFALAGP